VTRARATVVEARRERKMRVLLRGVENLPSIPTVAQEVGELVNDPRSDARKVAEVMRGDPALTAKVLRLVNSPYFAIPGGVSDVSRAISFLGFNTLHQLVLTVSVFGVLGGTSKEEKERAEALFRHSLATGGAAEALAKLLGHPDPAGCFTAGLLHDMGRLAMLQLQGELDEDLELHEHLGLRLATKWRFPEQLRAAIGHHHEEEVRSRRRVPSQMHPVIDVTLLADVITKRNGYGVEGDEPDLPKDVLERLNLLPSVEVKAHDELRRAMEKSEALMKVLAA